MPGAVGDVVDQDPEAWRDAVETSAYVADNSALRKREREFLPLSPPSWKDFARFETRVVEGIGQEWEKTLSTNISAMFYVVKAAVAHMPECSSIINTASVNATLQSPSSGLRYYKRRDSELHGRARSALAEKASVPTLSRPVPSGRL
jgi:NAD(P)-dependent dehydrogenase (short-subunit alcohol dehydrogenase family)